MLKKGLILGAAALGLLVLFAFVGCSNPASEGGVVDRYSYEGVLVTADELLLILADPENNAGVYAYLSDVNTTDTLGDTGYETIPAGITVNLYGGFTLADDLTVGGALNIIEGSTLTADSANGKLIIGVQDDNGKARGVVTVRRGGNLEVDDTAALELAEDTANNTVVTAPVPVVVDQIVNAARTGLIQGDSSHGESDGARLIFETDSVYKPTTAVGVSGTGPAVVEKLKQIASGLFMTDITTDITEEVPNLTVRKGTTLATTAALSLSGTLTVNGTLTLGSTAVITGVETAQGEGTLALDTQDFGPKAGIFLGVKTVTSAATLITADPLTVPAGTTLTLTGAINTGVGALVVEEGATLTAAGTWATQVKPLTINGTATFTAATFLLLAGSPTEPPVVVGPQGNATFTAATFAAAAGDIQINGEATFGAAAVPLGDVKVNGTLTVTGGSLTLASTGTKSLTLGPGAKLVTVTTGKLVVGGKTEITGAWQATGGATVIKSESVSTASIAGGELTAGAGANITQLNGTGNGLSIAAETTINLGGSGATAGGSIVLTFDGGAATDGGKLGLAAATSKIVLGVGNVPGAVNPPGVLTPTIGTKGITITGLTAVDFKIAGGVLVQIGGVGTGSINPSTMTDSVTIDSTSVFSGT